MIAGWIKPQLPFGSEGASPSLSSTRSARDQKLSLCTSYCDKVGLHDHAFNAALVQSLVGAFINATEILHEHVDSAGVPPGLKDLSGFHAPGMHDDLNLLTHSCHAITQDEMLQVISLDRVRHCSNAQCQDTAPFASSSGKMYGSTPTVMRGTYQSAHHCPAAHRSTLRPTDIVQRYQDLSDKKSCSRSRGLSFNSEEDFLLQEARLNALGGKTENDKSIQTHILKDCTAKTVNPCVKQDRKRDVRKLETFVGQEEHLQKSGVWSFAGTSAFSGHSSLVWVAAIASLLIAGAVFLTFQARKEKSKRPSVKRRIWKSQWYGSYGSQSWGHINFQTRVSEFPKYPMLGVDDGDNKLLRFQSESIMASAALSKNDHARQSDNTNFAMSTLEKAQGQPIRQTVQGSKAIPARQLRLNKAQHNGSLMGKVSVDGNRTGLERRKHVESSDNHDDTWKGRRLSSLSQSRFLSLNDKSSTHNKRRSLNSLDGRSLPDIIQENVSVGELKKKISIRDASRKFGHGRWGKDDELYLDERIQNLYQTIQAVEQHRTAAMLALEEEKQRSMALEEEISKQKEASVMLGEEVRFLKESHNALLTQLRKKYSTTAAARTAADLVYQDWERHMAAD